MICIFEYINLSQSFFELSYKTINITMREGIYYV